MLRKLIFILLLVLLVLVIATIGGSFYMIEYALLPNPERQDTAKRFAWLYENYPETRSWADSLRQAGALRDTFVVMPPRAGSRGAESGERHHAFVIRQQPVAAKTAILVHGWRDQAIGMFQIGRLYELMGYNVILPDLHAHGLSEGDAIGMGWHERKDVLHWMTLFRADTMVVHGVSMGAATTMNVSGEAMPDGVRSLTFVEDCGYTSVWDEFSYELREEFGLPAFPLLYASSLLCEWKYGWGFGEASPLSQVAKCRYPMLFIHGDDDHFVPSRMVHPLYDAKPGPKRLWVTKGTQHARSYQDYREEYASHLKDFLTVNSF